MLLTLILLALGAFAAHGTSPCPNSCICTSQSATCDTLDDGMFEFDVLHLRLRNIAQPIVIGEKFFDRKGLPHLETLSFENLKINAIDPTAFKKAEFLRVLNFANVTFSLSADSFVLATQLQVLSIEGCLLNEFIPFKSESIQIIKISKSHIKELTDESLINLPELTDITFTNNLIDKIDPKTFHNNFYLETLDLSYNKITELPHNIFIKNEELAALNLSGNPIKKINASMLSVVEKLVLQNCSLSEFKGGKFTEMGYLDLSHNEITELSSVTFGNMPELEYVNLAHNKLKTLPGDIFLNNTRLQTIYLDYNEFEILPKFRSYKDNFETNYFSCSDCGLENLDENVFEHMPKLITLNLSTNRLQKINPKMLSYIPQLKKLDLSYNMIANLSLHTFENNVLLSNINLAGNTITVLNPTIFEHMSDLKMLDISNNALKIIWEPTIFKIPYLEVLNLADNRLEVITRKELEVTPNLKTLNVNNNSFNCSAELDDSIQWLKKKSVQPSSLGTHMEMKDFEEITKDYIDNYWRKLCGDDDYEIYDSDDDADIDVDEDDDDEDEENEDDIPIDDDTFGPYILDDNEELAGFDDVESSYIPKNDRYSFLWPFFIFVVTALFVLLVVTNIILCVLRKRGHLPRNINLSWKNGTHSGFVYKPLTEEIPRSSIIINGVERNQTQFL
ncbi:leucine-rich repeat-containing protein 15 [Onthophagus taurus]|uniref:leucine-rich repeat-containing protein 15 n=1 Tax=Onthophagus taurus TaxID=166361 RepID=UPI0039BE1DF8